MPGLDERSFGTCVGASIYELAQVYGASFAVSEGALNTATLVKLSKVLMLIPLLLVLGAHAPRAGSARTAAATPIPFPWFVLGFVAVMLLNSSFTVHPAGAPSDPRVRPVPVHDGDGRARAEHARWPSLREGGVGWRLVGIGAVRPGAVELGSPTALVAATSARAAATAAPVADSAMLASPGGRLFVVGRLRQVPRAVAARERRRLGARSFPTCCCTTWARRSTTRSAGRRHRRRLAHRAAGRACTPASAILHDGRATSLREAVFAHGGEAQIVRDRFFGLDENEQDELYRYLGSL